jgi:DNA-binding MurR/RpiR family transcriptional regulator
MSSQSFADLVEAQSVSFSRAEMRVARHFASHMPQVLVHSAMELANALGTSDATIIRTTRSLGFDGLDSMRRAIADELNSTVSPASRLSRTIEKTGGDLRMAFEGTLLTQLQALTTLREGIKIADYTALVKMPTEATSTLVFGIGPSALVSEYFCTQLRRLGLSARSMSETGLLLADEMLALKPGNLLIILAYGRVYPELDVMIRQAQALGLQTVLVTDSLEKALGQRVSHVVSIPRGRIDAFSLHIATRIFGEPDSWCCDHNAGGDPCQP